jgi:PhnB protein
MRYIIMRKADQDTETGKMPSDELLMAMGQYNEALQKAGVLLDGMGLHPSSVGARVQFKNGKPIVTDGPFAETKELLAGFTLIQVKDHAEAIEWVKRWPALDGGGNVTLELRRVYEMEDFEDGPGLEKHREVGNALKAEKTGG